MDKYKPRIVHLIGTANVGGTERQMLTLVRGLSERYDFRILVGRPGRLLPEMQQAAPTKVLNKKMRIDIGYLLRLTRHIREARPDILHTWLPTSNAWGATASTLVRAPRLVTSERAIDTWKGGIWRYLDLWISHRADRITANSQAVKSRLVSRGISEELIEVIPNTIPVEPSSRLSRRSNTVGYLGRIDPAKGLDILVQALAIAHQTIPDIGLAVYGEAILPLEVEYERSVRLLATELGIVDCVRFYGGTVQPLERLSEFTLLAVPSRSEGFPNVVLEALVCSTPVVASRVGGIGEVIENEETGLLVPAEDPTRLAAAILEILTDPVGADAMAASGKKMVEARFGRERILRDWDLLYSSVLEG